MAVDSQFGHHILVTSNTEHFKKFRKRVDEVGGRGKKFYVDLWSKDELQVISTYHSDRLNLRYDVFGGSARNVKNEKATSAVNEKVSDIVDTMITLFFEIEGGFDDTFNSVFYHFHNTGNLDWSTKFLKCLIGNIISMRVLNLSVWLRNLYCKLSLGACF